MRRGPKIVAAVLAVLAVLLAVNAAVLDSQTKDAEPTVAGAAILRLPGGNVQVLSEGPTVVGPRRAGVPIVLLHCYACSLRWFDRVAPLLARRHRVVRIDLLGHGGSEKPSSGYSVPEQASLVAAALNRLGVEGATVVGNSLGGAVAIAVAEQASQLTDRLVVIGTAPDPDCCGDLSLPARIARWPVIGEALWRVRPEPLVKDQYGQAFAPGFDLESGFEDPDQVVEDLGAMTYTAYDEAKTALDDFVEELPVPSRASRAAIPLLVIFGAEDQIVEPEPALAAYADVPGARIETIEEAGHAPQVERPREVAALIETFAAEARLPPGVRARDRR